VIDPPPTTGYSIGYYGWNRSTGMIKRRLIIKQNEINGTVGRVSRH
jgi:hypothetical protein